MTAINTASPGDSTAVAEMQAMATEEAPEMRDHVRDGRRSRVGPLLNRRSLRRLSNKRPGTLDEVVWKR